MCSSNSPEKQRGEVKYFNTSALPGFEGLPLETEDCKIGKIMEITQIIGTVELNTHSVCSRAFHIPQETWLNGINQEQEPEAT